jgi:hypothetical protein
MGLDEVHNKHYVDIYYVSDESGSVSSYNGYFGSDSWYGGSEQQTQTDPWHGYRLEITDAEIILYGTMTSTNSTVDATFRFGEKGKLNLAAYKVSETRDGKKLNYTIVNNTLASPLARVAQSELQKGYFPFYSEYTYIKIWKANMQ